MRLINRKMLNSCASLLLVSVVAGVLWTSCKAFAILTQTKLEGDAETCGETYYNDPADLTTLKLVQVIFRHGARTPLHGYPKDPNSDFDYGVRGTGQLLLKGKRQAYTFGNYLRKRYDGFLSPLYDFEEVYTQSSDTDRTIMTAQMCLAGLFPVSDHDQINPHLQWQPISVHSLPRRIDNKIAFDAYCKEQAMLLQSYISSPQINALDSQNTWMYEYASEKSGLNITNFKGLVQLTDTLMIQEQNGVRLPDWTSKIYPSKTSTPYDLDFSAESATPQMQRLVISPLVTEMVRNMELALNGSPFLDTVGNYLEDYHNRSAKMYLFSGHDTTISAFLNSFDIYDGQPPNYVSSIIIELHKRNSIPQSTKTHDSHVIKIFYKKNRNEPVLELNFPLCRNPCTLAKFSSTYHKYLMDYSEWSSACSPP